MLVRCWRLPLCRLLCSTSLLPKGAAAPSAASWLRPWFAYVLKAETVSRFLIGKCRVPHVGKGPRSQVHAPTCQIFCLFKLLKIGLGMSTYSSKHYHECERSWMWKWKYQKTTKQAVSRNVMYSWITHSWFGDTCTFALKYSFLMSRVSGGWLNNFKSTCKKNISLGEKLFLSHNYICINCATAFSLLIFFVKLKKRACNYRDKKIGSTFF